jgi:hypothetical protein
VWAGLEVGNTCGLEIVSSRMRELPSGHLHWDLVVRDESLNWGPVCTMFGQVDQAASLPADADWSVRIQILGS